MFLSMLHVLTMQIYLSSSVTSEFWLGNTGPKFLSNLRGFRALPLTNFPFKSSFGFSSWAATTWLDDPGWWLASNDRFSVLSVQKTSNKKSNLQYTRGITPKLLTNGGVHPGGLASVQHSYKETSQRRWAVGDTVPIWVVRESNPRPPAPTVCA